MVILGLHYFTFVVKWRKLQMKKTLIAVLLTALLVLLPVMASAQSTLVGGQWIFSGWENDGNGWVTEATVTLTTPTTPSKPSDPVAPAIPANPTAPTSDIEVTETKTEKILAAVNNQIRYVDFIWTWIGTWTWEPAIDYRNNSDPSDALDPEDSSWFYYKEAVTLKNVDTTVEAEAAPVVSIPASGAATFALVASVLATLGCAVLPKK